MSAAPSNGSSSGTRLQAASDLCLQSGLDQINRSAPMICPIVTGLVVPIEMGRDRGQAGIIADA